MNEKNTSTEGRPNSGGGGQTWLGTDQIGALIDRSWADAGGWNDHKVIQGAGQMSPDAPEVQSMLKPAKLRATRHDALLADRPVQAQDL